MNDSMNKYTFTFKVKPGIDVEYKISVAPFDAVIREETLVLTATADEADEDRRRKQADQAAHDLIRSLSYELADGFAVEFQGRHVLRDTGQQSVTFTVKVDILPADLESRRAVERRERQAAQSRIADLAKLAPPTPTCEICWNTGPGTPPIPTDACILYMTCSRWLNGYMEGARRLRLLSM